MKVVVKVLAMVILLLLVAGLVLPMIGAPTSKSRRVDCANNLRQLGLALDMYAGDNREAFPESLLELEPYTAGQTSLLVSPHDASEAVVEAPRWSELTAANISYTFVAGGSLGSREPDQVLMFCDPGAHDNTGAHILYMGGHVEWKGPYGDSTFWGELARCGITPEMVAAATNKVIHVDDLEVAQ